MIQTSPAPTIESLKAAAPCLVYDCPDEVYFALPALSSTAIRAGRRSLMHMRHAMLNPKEPSDAMGLGSLVDTLVFEPEKLHERFMPIKGELPKRNSNIGKERYAALEAEAAGRIIVEEAVEADAYAMRDALLAHPATSRWLSHKGHAQAVVVWWESIEGQELLCKAKLDRFIPGVLALDCKTSRNGSPWAFARDAAIRGYPLQGGFYDRGFRAVTGEKGEYPFGLAVVENEAPHAVSAFVLKDEDLANGWNACKRIMTGFARAQKSGVFPGYGDGIEELDIPPWAYRIDGAVPVVDEGGDDGFI